MPLLRMTSRLSRRVFLAALVTLFATEALQNATADGETRTLKIHHTHSKEDIVVTFKRNGRYDEQGLAKLNHFLRDWRNQESDPHGSAAVRHRVGSLPGRRRHAADPNHLRAIARPPPIRCSAAAAAASPSTASTCSARRWTSTFRASVSTAFAPPACACSAAASASIRAPTSCIWTSAASGTGRACRPTHWRACSRTAARCTFPPMAVRCRVTLWRWLMCETRREPVVHLCCGCARCRHRYARRRRASARSSPACSAAAAATTKTMSSATMCAAVA